MLKKMKILPLLILFIFGSTILFAGWGEKKFEVETGKIVYDISGGGVLADDLNISIVGKGTLHFKNWGVDALIDEDYVEVVTGSLHDIHRVKTCFKLEDKQRFDVDFDTERILERPMPKGNFRTYYNKGLKNTGVETIAGYKCQVWEGFGVKRCLYKGVPLLTEHYILGIYYEAKAVDVKFNVKPESSKCQLPDFPLEKFSLYKNNIKTKDIKLPKKFSSIIKSVSSAIEKELKEQGKELDEYNLNKKQREFFLNRLGNNIFEKQKVLLVKLHDELKIARSCLQVSNSLEEANSCLEEVVEIKEMMSDDKDNKIDKWDDKNRKKILNMFDDYIDFLSSRISCVKGSKNIQDLAKCMKRK